MTGLELELDHVAVAVPSLDDALTLFAAVSGGPPTPVEVLPAQGVRVAFVGSVELLEPTDPDTPVGRFLSRRGSGLHHVAYATPDLDRELTRLIEAGYEPIDRTPRPGARGHRVAFLHPRSTGGILIELVERAGAVSPA